MNQMKEVIRKMVRMDLIAKNQAKKCHSKILVCKEKSHKKRTKTYKRNRNTIFIVLFLTWRKNKGTQEANQKEAEKKITKFVTRSYSQGQPTYKKYV